MRVSDTMVAPVVTILAPREEENNRWQGRCWTYGEFFRLPFEVLFTAFEVTRSCEAVILLL